MTVFYILKKPTLTLLVSLVVLMLVVFFGLEFVLVLGLLVLVCFASFPADLIRREHRGLSVIKVVVSVAIATTATVLNFRKINLYSSNVNSTVLKPKSSRQSKQLND